jgi:hydroxyethylthiazole kinase-like uncharacterized protein yjeF
MLPLYSVKQIRQIELSALAQQEPSLMQLAGQAAAQFALRLITAPAQTVLILAGPGNNGGDAFEVAVHLAHAGHKVHVLRHRAKNAASDECALALSRAEATASIVWLDADETLRDIYALVIDGLFGVGLKSQKFSASVQQHINTINALTCPILALDVPSGLNADTGTPVSNVAIRATHTITFIGDKTGLHTGDGRDYAGIVKVADLGISAPHFPAATMQLNQPGLFPKIFQPRPQNSNKGSNGVVHLIGGAQGMHGAIILAARAALYCGAGRVIAGFIETPPAFDAMQPEIMCRTAQQLKSDSDHVTVIGPGLGNSIASFEAVSRVLLSAAPAVLDADALNLMAQQPALMALCNGRDKGSTLLTPHPLEAARLLTCDVGSVQADRISAAKKLARRYSSVVILKGSGSIIADPDGAIVINPTGNPALATGGTGDVLAGACGALIAQHRDVWQAALAATWLHGTAADSLVQDGVGPVGLSAGELIHGMRYELNRTSLPLQKLRTR